MTGPRLARLESRLPASRISFLDSLGGLVVTQVERLQIFQQREMVGGWNDDCC